MKTTKRESLVRIQYLLILASPLVIMFAGWFVWCDWVPDATIARLPNATRDEVREMLGEPDHYCDPKVDREQAKAWMYTRPWRIAEFQVYFDSDGRVKEWWYDR